MLSRRGSLPSGTPRTRNSGATGWTHRLGGLAEAPGVAAAISADLRRAGIPHAITGAAAMAAYGYIRATRDVDILVVTTSLRLPEVFRIVRAHGFAGEDRALIISLRERYVAELTSDALSVEILVPVLPYHRVVLDRAVVKDIGGQRVPFVSVEDLIVLKMLWHRSKDVPDVEAMIVAGGAGLDREYVRRTLRSLIPDADGRHAELDRMLERYGPR